MNKYRTRLTVIFVLIIGLSVLAAGLFMAELLKSSHLKSLQESLLREVRLLQSTVDWTKTGSRDELIAYYGGLVQDLKRSADARVTFIAGDGAVLADSDHDPRTMDNHSGREEIAKARANGVGYSIRFSDTIRQNMMYAAVPIVSGGQPAGYLRLAISLAAVESSIRQLWVVLVAGLFVVFLIAGLVIYRISYAMTRPIERITKVAHEISSMNYQARVRFRSNDEVGRLGQAINTMAENLQQQVNRILDNESRLQSVLENMTSGVLMLGADRRVLLVNRAAEEMLGLAARELLSKHSGELNQPAEFAALIDRCMETRERVHEELTVHYPQERIVETHAIPLASGSAQESGALIVLHDITAVRRLERMRTEFVANVSHELKTPIAAVKGFAETLLAGALEDKETARPFLTIIYDESDRLDRLIGDLMDLSKIESKQVPMHFSPIDLREFVGDVLHMMQPAARKKRIQLHMRAAEDLYIEADEDKLRQVLINLLSNGVNYTPEGGRVTVEAEPVGDPEEYERIRLIVSDTGIGIPKKDLPRIFERFYRVDKARSRSSGGTGLGLSIVKHLVELHHGTIRVESEAGLGTQFVIELPVVQ